MEYKSNKPLIRIKEIGFSSDNEALARIYKQLEYISDFYENMSISDFECILGNIDDTLSDIVIESTNSILSQKSFEKLCFFLEKGNINVFRSVIGIFLKIAKNVESFALVFSYGNVFNVLKLQCITLTYPDTFHLILDFFGQVLAVEEMYKFIDISYFCELIESIKLIQDIEMKRISCYHWIKIIYIYSMNPLTEEDSSMIIRTIASMIDFIEMKALSIRFMCWSLISLIENNNFNKSSFINMDLSSPILSYMYLGNEGNFKAWGHLPDSLNDFVLAKAASIYLVSKLIEYQIDLGISEDKVFEDIMITHNIDLFHVSIVLLSTLYIRHSLYPNYDLVRRMKDVFESRSFSFKVSISIFFSNMIICNDYKPTLEEFSNILEMFSMIYDEESTDEYCETIESAIVRLLSTVDSNTQNSMIEIIVNSNLESIFIKSNSFSQIYDN